MKFFLVTIIAMNKEEKYAMSFTLLNFIGFYQMVNPNSPKMFGYNIYHVIHMCIVVLSTTVTVLGLTGFVYNNDEPLNDGFQNMQMLFFITCITVGNLKVIMVICNADELWNLLNIAHESFLSSTYCQQNYYKLKNCGEKTVRILLWYIFLFYMTAVSWITLPNIVNIDETANDNNIRKKSIANLKYPIKVKTYNTYYNTIYVTESLMTCYSTCGLVLFDIFLLSMLKLISVQYEIVSSAYQHLEFKSGNENGNWLYFLNNKRYV